MSGKGGAIRAGKAYYELGGNTDPLGTVLKKAEGMVRKSVGGIKRVYSGAKALLGKAGLSAAIAAASTALGSLLPGAAIKNWAETGAELVNAGKRANVAASQLGSLGYAARQTGADVGTMEGALKTIRDRTMEAARGSDQAQLAFARLGINFLSLSRMKPDDQLRLIAARLTAIPNPALRAAAAIELLGSADLLPTLERLDEFEARAKRLGIVMSTEDLQAANKFSQSLTDLLEIIKSVANAIAIKIAPALDKWVQKGTELGAKVREWIKDHGDFERLTQVAWAGIRLTWAEGVLSLENAWDTLTTGVEAAWKDMFGTLDRAGKIFIHGFQKDWNSAVAFVAKRMIDVQEIAGWAGLPGGLSTPAANDARRKIRIDNDQDNAALDQGDADDKKKHQAEQQRLQDELKARKVARAADVAKLRGELGKLLADAKAPPEPDKKPGPGKGKNDLAQAAGGGIAQALVNFKGIGAQDVRTKEGFAAVTAGLRQQSLLQQQIYWTRRQTLALEKLGVLT